MASIYSTAFSPFKKKLDPYAVPSTQSNVGVGINVAPSTKPSTTSVLPKDQPYDFSQAKSVYTPPKLDVFAKKETPTSIPSYLDTITNIANKSKQFYDDRAKSDESLYNTLYDQKIKAAQDQAPIAQEAFNQFKTDTEAGADQSKVQAETNWGNDQRELAKTRMESESRLRNKFAGQNTSDSFGVGSSQEANTNLESDFNRQTAQGLQSKSDKLFQIDQTAKSLISQEALKLKQTLSNIQSTVFGTVAEKAAAIKKAYEDAKAGILEIESNLANLKYQNAQSTPNLSAEFLRTGVPTTPAEFEFLQKNKDAFTNVGGTGNSQKQQLIDIVDKIAGGDVGAMTGAFKTDWIPGTQGAMTKNYYDQLKSLLSLENRAKLKGSGAISDFEARTLDRAASALGQNLSEDQFRQVLGDLRTSLGGGQPQNSTQIGRFTVSY